MAWGSGRDPRQGLLPRFWGLSECTWFDLAVLSRAGIMHRRVTLGVVHPRGRRTLRAVEWQLWAWLGREDLGIWGYVTGWMIRGCMWVSR